ncbi:hypothetical protein J3Q64DRAFT_1711876 [Phycomyces blakesleeanus]|uniref:Protein kinase domain-containing protein n=1 Tax=Phycomyces blakesleeanus TaxID=4837 RepID=A0ABR3BFI6_PHYBL
MESRFLLDVIVGEGATIFELLTSENQTLLIRRNTFLVLDLLLNVINAVRALNLEGDGLAGEGLHKDLHGAIYIVNIRSFIHIQLYPSIHISIHLPV